MSGKAIEAAARALATWENADWDARTFAHTPSGQSPDEMRAGYLDAAQAAVQAYLAAMEAEGFVMVPVEPSGRALQKGLSVISEFLGGDPTIGDARMIYSAMLAARPQPKD